MEMIAPYIDFRKQLVDAEAAVAEYIAQQEASRNPYAPQRRPEEAEEDPPSMVALKALQAEVSRHLERRNSRCCYAISSDASTNRML